MHDEVVAQRLHFVVDLRAGQLDHNADAAAHVVVGIHHAVLGHEAGKAAHGDLLADGGGRLADQIVDGLARVRVERLSEHLLNAGRSGSGDVLGEIAAQILEAIGVGDEVGLAVDLDGHAHAVLVHIGIHHALGGDTAGLLGGGGETLLAQEVDGLVHVAVALDERLLAVHHTGAGALAQFLNQGSSNISHNIFLQLRSITSLRRPAQPARPACLPARRPPSCPR